MKYPQVWDLDTFFKGGSQSSDFQHFVKETEELVDKLFASTSAKMTLAQLVNELVNVQKVMQRLRHGAAFVSCLKAQNVKDEHAVQWQGKLNELQAKLQNIWVELEATFVRMEDGEWQELLNHPQLSDITFSLNERRQAAAEKLAPEQEKLAAQLAVDGYHAWGEVYNQAVGRMEIPFEEGGETKRLSPGQLSNRLSSKDRKVRKRASKAYAEAWKKETPLFASTLNHLAGFRLNLYRARGWNDVLKEPLLINRMKRKTLDAMWSVINENKPKFYEFMDRKAKLLGVDKLAMHDIHAPLPSGGNEKIAYDDACELIIRHFRKVSPKLARFTEGALRDGWVEAEDRPGKRPGGFCTSFPLAKQSRIFMTYNGTMSNVATLAHELGHAYHGYCLKDKAPLAQRYAMNVAETASTFAETIVADALVQEAKTETLKLSLLENKVNRAIAFFMNIHARFLFETRFYEARKQKRLSVKELCDLMEEAQREAYGNQLSSYSPTLWAHKLHFHITGVPFYNFPYTFGYLFSIGIYQLALEKGASFEDDYIALLQDTASMTVEELALKHVGADLTKRDFWQSAMDLIIKDVDLFLEMTS
ncbi:M3 family oligoendopeptidase [Halalkalibacterium halodurans]|uniref:M3 family oligoendopeptidase n=1 Tax=Halalkalibacterium halodurans TaxID=86665 RepID=UPI002AAA31B4|nr:M3 family oligoendopeptidase [Halalkalibacterium halodurans]MDY7221368.1 M3 family oligoendopeptidase [Halalkalibacterium halodurans]MDY7240607.1 M3 family oligoendopeptidase [Halalkalibacterium halodurans]